MATQPTQNATPLMISRPEKGQTAQYTIKPGMTLALQGFTFGDGVASIRGTDLVIQFADGSQLVLQDFVEVAQYNNPPVVMFDDGTTLPASDLLLQVAALDGAPLNMAALDAGLAAIEPAAGPAGVAPSNLASSGLGSASNFAIDAIGGNGVAVSTRPDNVSFGNGFNGANLVAGPTGPVQNAAAPVPATNSAPVVFDTTVALVEDAPLTALNIAAPIDGDGDILTVTLNTLPALGALTLNGVAVVAGQQLSVAQLQSLEFTPNANANGNAAFTYTVSDGQATGSATVNLLISPVNDSPVAPDATVTFAENAGATALNLPIPTDVDGDVLTVTIDNLPLLGTLLLNGAAVTAGQQMTVAQLQTLQFNPSVNTSGQISFTAFSYTVTDGQLTDTATINLVVTPVNDAPVALDTTITLAEDAPITALNLAAPTDADGDPLTVTLNTLPGLGSLTLNGVAVVAGQQLTIAQLQSLQFTPSANANGNTAFTYTVSDGQATDAATVNLMIIPVNDAPNADPNGVPVTLTVDDDAAATALNIPAPTDVDGDVLTVTVNNLPGIGTLLLNGAAVLAGQQMTVAQLQDLRFDPNNNQFGSTQFTYTVNDGKGGVDTATVSINVVEQDAPPPPVNSAPVAFDVTVTLAEDSASTALNIPRPTDVDGDLLTVTLNTLPGLGSLTLNGAAVAVGQQMTVAQLQSLQFTPTTNFVGNTAFTYTVRDPSGAFDAGQVNINITPVNDAPVAFDATLTVDDDAAPVALNIPRPTDVEGDVLIVTINSVPGIGTLLLNGLAVNVGQQMTVVQLQSLRFNPNDGQFGTTQFTYRVDDEFGGRDTATVTINVVEQDVPPVNTAPVAFDADLVVDDDRGATALNIPAPTDADGDSLTVTINNLPGVGTLLLNGAAVVAGQQMTVAQLQSLQFDPNNGQFADTSFTYTVADGRGGSDTATVRVWVVEQDVNTAPVAQDSSVTMTEDAGLTNLNIPAPTDTDGNGLTITINSLPAIGFMTLNGVNVVLGQQMTVAQLQSLQFTPSHNANGDTSFTYTVSDGQSIDTATVAIHVTPVNDAPLAFDATLVVDDDAGASSIFIPFPSDVDGDSLTVTINNLPGVGTLLLNGAAVVAGQQMTVLQLQSLLFDPNNSQFADTGFDYTVTDPSGLTDTARVSIWVVEQDIPPVNTAPVAFDADLVVDDDRGATALNIPAPTDADGDSLTVTINNLPGVGTLLLNGAAVVAGQQMTVLQLQSLQFDPNNGQFADTSFTYTVADGRGGSDTATVRVWVVEQDVPPVNTAPVAFDTTLTVDDDRGPTAIHIQAPFDADGDSLSVTIFEVPDRGTGKLLLDGVTVVDGQQMTVAQLQSLQFEPRDNGFGDLRVDYTVADGRGGSTIGHINIHVVENDPLPGPFPQIPLAMPAPDADSTLLVSSLSAVDEKAADTAAIGPLQRLSALVQAEPLALSEVPNTGFAFDHAFTEVALPQLSLAVAPQPIEVYSGDNVVALDTQAPVVMPLWDTLPAEQIHHYQVV